MIKIFYILLSTCFFSVSSASADVGSTPIESMIDQVRLELEKKNPDAQVQIEKTSFSYSLSGSQLKSKIQFVEDSPATGSRFLLLSDDGKTVNSGVVQYKLWKKAAVAKKRILPGEKILPDAFSIENVLVSHGIGRDFRGVMISDPQDLRSTEGRQTILEGQYIATTAIRRVPDIRKGEGVTIRLSSGEVVLNTPGVAEEASYFNSPVHVLATKSKRVLVGTLIEGRVVEVKL